MTDEKTDDKISALALAVDSAQARWVGAVKELQLSRADLASAKSREGNASCEVSNAETALADARETFDAAVQDMKK